MKIMKEIVKHFGNRYRLAKALGIKPCSVYAWTRIPELRAYQIEKLTEGKFKVEDILKEKS